jgi:glycosyltransferase involved in cell wall biosynthesis
MVRISERYERRALKATHSVFALSEYTRAAVQSIASGKVVVAPCGVDTDLFRPAEKPDGSYIVCVARFSDPRKNVRLLLDAYAMLQKRVAAAPDLYLIGDPPSEEARLQLRSLGLAEKVRLIGPKRGEELAELYRNALFFVLTSNEEGLGIVILEAMASGLPVVSTMCGGPATAIVEGETGFLTPVGDAQALADAMEILLRDPVLFAYMGKEGRRIAEKRFSLAAAGKVFLDRYDDLLNGRENELQCQESVEDSFSVMPAGLR